MNVTLFDILIVSYSAVHLKFQYAFWATPERDVFGKYQAASDPAEALVVGKNVYFTKATWMILLVWMLYAGIPFPLALSISFLVYGIELLVFFPVRRYVVLNVLLATGCVIEQVLQRIG